MVAPHLRLSLVGFIALSAACGAPPSSGAALTPVDAAVPSADDAATPSSALADAVDALFTDAETNDAFSGSVIVVDGGKRVLEKGYGFADRTTKRKNAPDTLFRIGSVSKQFTATAILALVEDGKLALTDPLSKFFPDYPRENLAMDGEAVTIHHLLSHTSGLPDPSGTPSFKNAAWRRPIAPTEQVTFAKTLPLVRKPGSAFQYLNYNFLLAALIVEQISARPYETLLRQRFFEPLGMKDSGTVLPASETGRAAVGYAAESKGAFVALSDNPTFNKDPDVTLAFGSGQVYSTVRDLALWDRALAGETVLKPAVRDLLFTPNSDDYGYGWVIRKNADVTMAWHNGALSPLGFTALIVRVPAKDRFVAYLSNFDLPLTQPFEAKVASLAMK